MMTSEKAIKQAVIYFGRAESCQHWASVPTLTQLGTGYATLALALQEQERRVIANQHVDRSPG